MGQITLQAPKSRVPTFPRQIVFVISNSFVWTKLDSTTGWIWYNCEYSHSNQQISQFFMAKKTYRHGRQHSRTLRAKFWVSLVTGTSASGALANVSVTRCLCYINYLVRGTRFPWTNCVPTTSIYCAIILEHPSQNLAYRENCILLKNDGNPISFQERACMETTYP